MDRPVSVIIRATPPKTLVKRAKEDQTPPGVIIITRATPTQTLKQQSTQGDPVSSPGTSFHQVSQPKTLVKQQPTQGNPSAPPRNSFHRVFRPKSLAKHQPTQGNPVTSPGTSFHQVQVSQPKTRVKQQPTQRNASAPPGISFHQVSQPKTLVKQHTSQWNPDTSPGISLNRATSPKPFEKRSAAQWSQNRSPGISIHPVSQPTTFVRQPARSGKNTMLPRNSFRVAQPKTFVKPAQGNFNMPPGRIPNYRANQPDTLIEGNQVAPPGILVDRSATPKASGRAPRKVTFLEPERAPEFRQAVPHQSKKKVYQFKTNESNDRPNQDEKKRNNTMKASKVEEIPGFTIDVGNGKPATVRFFVYSENTESHVSRGAVESVTNLNRFYKKY